MPTRKLLRKYATVFVGLQSLAFLLGIAVWWSAWFNLYRLTRVAEGRLYRSAEMVPEVAAMWCERLGIATVIDFRRQTDKAEAEAAAVAQAGARHFHLPSRQVPSEDVVKRFLKIMDDEDNHPALIHCTHGVGRTGVFAAVYRMEYERWSNQGARLESLLHSGSSTFGLGASKGRFLDAYEPRREQTP